MGEIRSTLDIIMEKAERVTVTDEDKDAFMKNEVEGKVRGLLQKYLDGIINQERLKREVRAMSDERYVVATTVLKKECLGRIEPGEDNRPLLKMNRERTIALFLKSWRMWRVSTPSLFRNFFQDMNESRKRNGAIVKRL